MSVVTWQRVASLRDIPDGRGWPVRVGSMRIALFAAGGRVYALDNRCLHIGSPIDEGVVEDGCVACPWHGWTYELASGDQLIAVGRRRGLHAYPARLDGDDILVDIA